MRKYFLSLVLIITSLILLAYLYFANNKVEYSETIFSNEAKSFNASFTNFIESVERDIKIIQINFNNTQKVKDTAYSKKFFLDYLDKNPYLISAGLMQSNYTIAVKKDNQSLIYAIDSTEAFDIIRWQRFENGKFISSWEESLEESIKQTPWYNDLNKNNKNQIRWYFNNDRKVNEESGKDDELFYAGYSYTLNDVNNIILLRFSRRKLKENFNIYSKYNDVSLLVETAQGNTMDLVSGESKSFQKVNNKNSPKDSLSVITLNHFKKFDTKESGIFNFSFKKENYWNSFQKFSSKIGINYYLLTIPDKDIQNNEATLFTDFLKWAAIIFIALGVSLLFIKSRFFYRRKRVHIKSVKEILEDDESRYLEFKSSLRWDYRQEKVNPVLEKVILKTIAAFGNTDGGILLIGVDDDKNIIGLEKDFDTLKKSDADYYEIHLRNIFHKFMGVKYVSKNIRMQFETCENQNIVCIINIFAANEPLYLKTKNKNGQIEEQFFVRSGNSSQEIKSIAEINDYINTRFKK